MVRVAKIMGRMVLAVILSSFVQPAYPGNAGQSTVLSPSEYLLDNFTVVNDLVHPIEAAFTSDSVVGLSIDGSVSSFTASFNGHLEDESGFVRIILVDSDNNEHLVYEVGFPLYEGDFVFQDGCEETCITDVTPASLKIETEKAEVYITECKYSPPTGPVPGSVQLQNALARKY